MHSYIYNTETFVHHFEICTVEKEKVKNYLLSNSVVFMISCRSTGGREIEFEDNVFNHNFIYNACNFNWERP
jgi:hypothetical protein